jgi:NNP family nitrate/nitrite transporter-like MFS transporter
MLLLLFPFTLLSGLASNYFELLVFRVAAGLAFAVFPTGVSLVAGWFPSRRMGLAQGIFGSGSTAAFASAALIAPMLAGFAGWRGSLILCSLTLPPMALIFWLTVKDPPSRSDAAKASKRSRMPILTVLKTGKAWLVVWINFAFFGLFLAATSWLPSYFVEEYGLTVGAAGTLVFYGISVGVLARPLGGLIADKIGSWKLVFSSLLILAFLMLVLGLRFGIDVSILAVLFLGWFFTFGTGSFYRLPPSWFPREVGTVVGFASTVTLLLGGLILPPTLGCLIDLTRSFMVAFAFLAAISFFNSIGGWLIRKK